MVCRSNWSFLTYPKFYSSGTIWIIFPKIKLSLNHLFSYIQGFLSTWNKNISFEALQFFFFNLPWRKTCKIWWKKIVRMKRRGEKKTQPFTISVSRFTLLQKKRNNFIGTRCWHCVSYWRWKEFSWTIAVTKGYWWQLEFLWLITCTTDRRTAENRNYLRPRLNQHASFNMQGPQDTVLFCFVSFIQDKSNIFPKIEGLF